MKYANQINTALVVASALFVVYILTQTYWSTDPAEEIVRPIRQDGQAGESPSPEVSMPGPERRSPATRRLPQSESETAPVEPSATSSAPQAAPRRLAPTPSRTTPLSRSPASRTSLVPPVTSPSGNRPARPVIRPPRNIVPEEKRQTGEPAPTPPVRSSAPEQRLPGP